jgi:hypothetical protein
VAMAATRAKTFFISNALYFQRGYCNDTRMRTPAAAGRGRNAIPESGHCCATRSVSVRGRRHDGRQ